MRSVAAIIVLTHDNFDDTVECLDSVLESRYPDFEVVLVDNHSTDGSIEKLRERYPTIHHVQNERNLGVAGGRNAGWRYTRTHIASDLLVFLDNDTVVQPETLSTLVGYLADNPDSAIACAKTYTAPPSITIMSVGMSVNLYTGSIGDIGMGERDIGCYGEPRIVDACGGFGFIVRTSVFEDCDGLDEDYNPYGWEDVDFCLRAQRMGHRCHYVPEAVMYHKGCKIGRGYVPLYEKYKTKHYFQLLSRHANWLQKCSCGIVIPLKALIVVIQLVTRGEGRVVLSQLSGAYEMLLRAIVRSGSSR